ncbi:MAG TPA: hypothetical protein VNO79_02025 [Actinomycetota bacterium]|nr:hypothetical protein [Actinomycetota bacterium]
MDPVQSLVNGAIVAVAAGVVGLLIHGFRREMREAVAGLEARFEVKLGETGDELRGEIAALRQEMRSELAQVRDELKVLRSDLTLVALAVGAKPHAQNA